MTENERAAVLASLDAAQQSLTAARRILAQPQQPSTLDTPTLPPTMGDG